MIRFGERTGYSANPSNRTAGTLDSRAWVVDEMCVGIGSTCSIEIPRSARVAWRCSHHRFNTAFMVHVDEFLARCLGLDSRCGVMERQNRDGHQYVPFRISRICIAAHRKSCCARDFDDPQVYRGWPKQKPIA